MARSICRLRFGEGAVELATDLVFSCGVEFAGSLMEGAFSGCSVAVEAGNDIRIRGAHGDDDARIGIVAIFDSGEEVIRDSLEAVGSG